MVDPSARNLASESQIGNRRAGFIHRNCRSRLTMRCVSSQARRRGPRVEGMGEGSRIVRCRDPDFDCVGNDGVVGETASEVMEWEDARVRWHSLSRAGMDDAGRMVGREKA